MREELLRGLDDPALFVAVAEWSGQDAINRYLASLSYEEIKPLTRAITGVAAAVHRFGVVEG